MYLVRSMTNCRDPLNSSVNVSLIRCILLTFSAGHVQTADSSLLSASAFSLPSLCIERAKWMASQVIHQMSPFHQRGCSLHITGLQSCSLLRPAIEEKFTIRYGDAVLWNLALNFFNIDICSNIHFTLVWHRVMFTRL